MKEAGGSIHRQCRSQQSLPRPAWSHTKNPPDPPPATVDPPRHSEAGKETGAIYNQRQATAPTAAPLPVLNAPIPCFHPLCPHCWQTSVNCQERGRDSRNQVERAEGRLGTGPRAASPASQARMAFAERQRGSVCNECFACLPDAPGEQVPSGGQALLHTLKIRGIEV